MFTFTLTWSAELLRVGKFIPLRSFEVHQMEKEQSSMEHSAFLIQL